MSSFGRVYRVTTYGESHGKAVGCIIEGMPSGFEITQQQIQYHLSRRRPGQSSLTTERSESDTAVILSGIQNNITLGTPICISIANSDTRSSDYSQLSAFPRPGHADFSYRMKYGCNAESGGGRASARETAARVAAGALAINYLEEKHGILIISWVESVENIKLPEDLIWTDREEIDRLGSIEITTTENGDWFYKNCEGVSIDKDGNIINAEIEGQREIVNTRCPNPDAALRIAKKIRDTKIDGDSLGGIIRCKCYNVPSGLGEPCFDKLQALLAHAMLSIPSTKGFEIGSGFEGTHMLGSQHNDCFLNSEKGLFPMTNHAGGVLGGISSGATIDFRVAFKPVSTIKKPQLTAKWDGDLEVLEAKGRHDSCVLPRATPIVESMAAMVIMDCLLLQKMQSSS
ncbi:unnamed protein product [Blepharisma stoltei]|uniref:chorismate synthase n=1 Tax=Blepharisma stoltei TaxID=1481888 RepID=A0AAU9IWI4_9CILI|nr:unnamed protein product [Blepharisma stoltei]